MPFKQLATLSLIASLWDLSLIDLTRQYLVRQVNLFMRNSLNCLKTLSSLLTQEHKNKYSYRYNQKIHNSAQLIIFFTKSWTYCNCSPSHCSRNASSAISIKCGNHKSKRINYKKCANVSGEEKILAIKKYNLTNKKKKKKWK